MSTAPAPGESEARPPAPARVSPARGSASATPLATVAQLKRLNDLSLLPKALGGQDHVTRETAWVVLEEALEQGLWQPKRESETRPEWAPPRRDV